MMRTMMGVVKNSHGVFLVRKKVPEKLQTAVAQLQGSSKERVVWLQKSLGTKDRRRADTLAKGVLMEFDRVIAKAEASAAEHPLRSAISDTEIENIAATTSQQCWLKMKRRAEKALAQSP
jgi:hypothetical protein